jgi:hypothetical protein
MTVDVTTTQPIEMTTDPLPKELVRLVVKRPDGKQAIFFVELKQGRDSMVLEVVGKCKNGESIGQAVADFQEPVG